MANPSGARHLDGLDKLQLVDVLRDQRQLVRILSLSLSLSLSISWTVSLTLSLYLSHTLSIPDTHTHSLSLGHPSEAHNLNGLDKLQLVDVLRDQRQLVRVEAEELEGGHQHRQLVVEPSQEVLREVQVRQRVHLQVTRLMSKMTPRS